MDLINPKDMYITLVFPFNANGGTGRELLLLARKFRLALFEVWDEAKRLNNYGKISMS